MNDTGKLYIVSTPIGNLEDITLRALRILGEVDLVAAEDTRHTRQLLAHFELHKPLESFHSFNEHGKVEDMLTQLRSGRSIALVSDAGTPSVADPGYLLVTQALEAGIEPVVIPGVSAVTFAVTASGLPVDKFEFWGFAPVKPGRRKKFFEAAGRAGHTVFFFESPFRIARALRDIADILGAETRLALIREATKLHEEVLRGSAGELAALKREWRGEFVIGIGRIDGDTDDKERDDE